MQSDPDRASPSSRTCSKARRRPAQEADFVRARGERLAARAAASGAHRARQRQPRSPVASHQLHERDEPQADEQRAGAVDIYNSSADTAVKRAVLTAFVASQDKDRLMQIARNEKNPELRIQAIHMLGATAAQPKSGNSTRPRHRPTSKSRSSGRWPAPATAKNCWKWRAPKRTPDSAAAPSRAWQGSKAPNTSDALAALYSTEQDKDVKRTIVSSLFARRM